MGENRGGEVVLYLETVAMSLCRRGESPRSRPVIFQCALSDWSPCLALLTDAGPYSKHVISRGYGRLIPGGEYGLRQKHNIIRIIAFMQLCSEGQQRQAVDILILDGHNNNY